MPDPWRSPNSGCIQGDIPGPADFRRIRAGTRTRPSRSEFGISNWVHMGTGSKDPREEVVLPDAYTGQTRCQCSQAGKSRSVCDCSWCKWPPVRKLLDKDPGTCCECKPDWPGTRSCPHIRGDNPRRDCRCTPVGCTRRRSSLLERGTQHWFRRAKGSKDSWELVVALVRHVVWAGKFGMDHPSCPQGIDSSECVG